MIAVGGAAQAVDVTQCGQRVAPLDTGVLTGDLVCDSTSPGLCAFCPSCAPHADMPCQADGDCASLGAGASCESIGVLLGSRAKLELGGFELSSAPGDPPSLVVFCERGCTVTGPGEVAGGGAATIAGSYRVLASTLVVRDGFIGFRGRRIKLDGVTVSGQHLGIDAYTLSMNGASLTSNGPSAAARARAVRARNVIVSDNTGPGLSGYSVVADTLTATNNGGYGVAGNRVALRDSTVTGNSPADIASVGRPRLITVTCDKSVSLDRYSHTPIGTWGLCAAD